MTSPPPTLPRPLFLTPKYLRSQPDLTTSIATLANSAFTRAKSAEPERWYIPSIRFPDNEAFFWMLGCEKEGEGGGEDSIVAVILDEPQDQDAEFECGNEKEKEIPRQSVIGNVVAIAAAVRWKGGYERESAGTEKGWEIKAVCVSGDERYHKRGVAGKVVVALEEEVLRREKERRQKEMGLGTQDGEEGEGKNVLTLWILAAESQAGPYWRKRGYVDVRSKTYGEGVWGCRSSFEMVVLRKDVEVPV